MARGTFANIRLVNKFLDKAGPRTKHWPSEDVVRISAGSPRLSKWSSKFLMVIEAI